MIVYEAQYDLCKQCIYIYIPDPFSWGKYMAITFWYIELGEIYMEKGTPREHLVWIGDEGIDNFHRDRSTLWK